MSFNPPAIYSVANQQPRLPRATSSLALNACRDGASTASLGNLGTVRHHPLGEKLPPNIQPKPPLSQFQTISPCPITIHPRKQLLLLQPVKMNCSNELWLFRLRQPLPYAVLLGSHPCPSENHALVQVPFFVPSHVTATLQLSLMRA